MIFAGAISTVREKITANISGVNDGGTVNVNNQTGDNNTITNEINTIDNSLNTGNTVNTGNTTNTGNTNATDNNVIKIDPNSTEPIIINQYVNLIKNIQKQ